MKSKHQLTLDWCTALGRDLSEVESLYNQIWRNLVPTGGYRLTKFGFEVLAEIGYPHWHVKIKNTDTKTGATLLAMDRYLDSPYFVTNKGQDLLHLFSEEVATQLMMYDGDLAAFLAAHTYLSR